ncbi:MAG TPA: glycosyltransferase family 2 protein [Chryseosolibacter sp.]
MNPVKLSVVIITFNEEQNIGDCLESVLKVADEIVVVDSFSTDNTKGICDRYAVRFIQNRFDGHIQQKNFAMSQASHDVILSLDADERLDAALAEEIKRVKSNFTGTGYSVNRLNNYCGKFVRFGEWNPDWKIRLWDRRKGAWGGENPHDQVILKDARPIKLKGRLLHFTYRTVSAHFLQMHKFSDIAASESFKRGKRSVFVVHQVLYPFFYFFKVYFLKLGFLDGYSGYVLAVHAAYYRFLKYTKLAFLNSKMGRDDRAGSER